MNNYRNLFCALSWYPTVAVWIFKKLPVNQRTNARNDLDLALYKTNRNEFVQHRQVWLRFHPFAKLECKPFPIRCEVAAHQQHNSHDACNKFSETDVIAIGSRRRAIRWTKLYSPCCQIRKHSSASRRRRTSSGYS